jgi:hypothetical protein
VRAVDQKAESRIKTEPFLGFGGCLGKLECALSLGVQAVGRTVPMPVVS